MKRDKRIQVLKQILDQHEVITILDDGSFTETSAGILRDLILLMDAVAGGEAARDWEGVPTDAQAKKKKKGDE